MTAEDLDEIVDELGLELPSSYRDFLLTMSAIPDFRELLHSVSEKNMDSSLDLADIPISRDEVVEANLCTLDEDNYPDLEDANFDAFLVIGGDGFGNSFVVDTDEDDPLVMKLSHDPDGIESICPLSVWCASVMSLVRNGKKTE